MTEPLRFAKAGRPAALRALLLVLVFSLPIALAVRPVTDPDIWSHLRHGQWIVEHRAVPLVDAFSLRAAGKRWIAYSWLFEVLVYGLYESLGLPGLVLYTAGLALVVAWALLGLMDRVQPDPTVSCILCAAGILAMAPLLVHPRPWLLTIVFYIAETGLIFDVRQGSERRPFLLLPLLFALWSNVHIQFVYGFFALAVAAVEPLVEENGDPHSRGRRFRRMLALLGLCGVATLLNPYGIRIYLAVYDAGAAIHPSLYLQEFQAPQLRSVFDWIMLAVIVGGIFVLGRKGRVRSWPGMLLASGVALAFRTARDVWFGVVAALVVLGTHVPRARENGGRLSGRWRLGVAATVALVVVSLGSVRAGRDRLEASVAETFPVGAAAEIERRGISGSMYNHYDWGGYLMWRLPGLPVSVDGRAPIHGDARILRSVATWAGQEGWDTDPELLEAAVVIGERKSALVSLLRGDARFELVYEDGVAAVFIPRRSDRPWSVECPMAS